MILKTFSQHIHESLSTLEDKWKDKFDTLFINDTNRGDIKVSSLIIAKDKRNQGIGTAFMNDLIDYADTNNKRIVLSPGDRDDRHGTTSRTRLIKFYKRFGFIENKGRNKDYRISDTMIRNTNAY